MHAAARAEFVQLQTIGIVPAILGRRIGTLPAFAASQSDDLAVFLLGHD
jgi:hypothetical protein